MYVRCNHAHLLNSRNIISLEDFPEYDTLNASVVKLNPKYFHEILLHIN